jgi:perosamine synthetase
MKKYKILQVSPLIDEEDINYVTKSLKSCWVTEGRYSIKFIKRIKKLTKSKYAVLAPNGTLGLYLGILGLNLPKNSEIILPSFSFYASATSIIYANLKPVFVDVDQNTYCMDPTKIEKLINKKTSAIMVVHTYGQSANINKIIKIAKKYKLKIIEDAAQVINVYYKNKHCGTFGDVGVISFYGDKTITTGEGAVILIKNKKIFKKISLLRNQGRLKSGTFKHSNLGMNFRMTDLQCALGMGQLNKLKKITTYKLEKYEYYKKMLSNVGDLQFGKVNNYSTFVPFRFFFLTSYKKKLMHYLENNLIQTRSFFFPLHKQPQLKNYRNGGCKVTESLYNKGICLPIHNKVSKKDINFICNKIKIFFKK